MGGRPSSSNCLKGLVKTHHRTLPVVLFVIKVQHVLHPGHELPAQLGDAPFLFPPRLEFVFLSIWRTVSREMLPANSNSTTLSASRWSVQLACPSGGLLHAMATRCASCLPSNLRSRPGRGLSLMAASSPSSTNRFRTLATVAALIKSTPAISSSRSPSSALSNASARLTVRTDSLPRWETSLRRERFGFSQLDFVLDGSHVWILPHSNCSDWSKSDEADRLQA